MQRWAQSCRLHPGTGRVNRFWRPLQSLPGWWQDSSFAMRIGVGTAVVSLIGLAGLTPRMMHGLALAWPFAALIAAVGWGRSGVAFLPMFILIGFGFAQDIAATAPLGCFAVINLVAYGASSFLYQTFDSERSVGIGIGLPPFLLAIGFVLVWSLASLVSGHPQRLQPLIAALFTSILLQGVIGSVFDLGAKPGAESGATP